MKIVYIAHPISGNIKNNIKKIKEIIRDINLNDGDVLPFAHYLVDLDCLDDTVPSERKRGIKNDIELLSRKFIDELWLFGNKISEGMIGEIITARQLNIPIIPMSDETKFQYNLLINKINE